MPVGGTSDFGSMLAICRAKPRTSISRLADDTWLRGGKVAHARASFVVMVLALRLSMNDTKSRRRDARSRYLYPSLGACSDSARVLIADRSLRTSRPRQAQCPECVDVHLCVNSCRVVALVP